MFVASNRIPQMRHVSELLGFTQMLSYWEEKYRRNRFLSSDDLQLFNCNQRHGGCFVLHDNQIITDSISDFMRLYATDDRSIVLIMTCNILTVLSLSARLHRMKKSSSLLSINPFVKLYISQVFVDDDVSQVEIFHITFHKTSLEETTSDKFKCLRACVCLLYKFFNLQSPSEKLGEKFEIELMEAYEQGAKA